MYCHAAGVNPSIPGVIILFLSGSVGILDIHACIKPVEIELKAQ
jgi:hypothetical protein